MDPKQRHLLRLRGERRNLAMRLAKLDAEIEKQDRAGDPVPTPAQLERWFEDLSAGLDDLPPLPADFSRADLYDDHD
jgi:hypothetical protein